MNYSKIYRQLCDRGRMRKKANGVYLEKHHIIPTFFYKHNKRKLRFNDGILCGDGNHIGNITLLTAREHFLAHILLCKIFYGTKWQHRCESQLQFFFTKIGQTHPRSKHFNPSDTKKYQTYAIMSNNAIQKCRTGTMPVKDVITNEMIGQVQVDHPKVVSGEWVHHSKNVPLQDERKKSLQKSNTGLLNGNQKGYTDDQLYDQYKTICDMYSTAVSIKLWVQLAKHHNLPYVTSFKKFRFDGSGFSYMVKKYAKDNNIEIDKTYFFSKKFKDISKDIKQRIKL